MKFFLNKYKNAVIAIRQLCCNYYALNNFMNANIGF